MRLATLASSLPAELAALLPLLAQLDPPVLTSRTLLFTPAQALLESLLGLHSERPDTATLRESSLKRLQQTVRRADAPPIVLATMAYDDELAGRRRRPGLTTGVVELDKSFSTVSGLIELSGPEGAGKTVSDDCCCLCCAS